jgi:hypothetical protein
LPHRLTIMPQFHCLHQQISWMFDTRLCSRSCTFFKQQNKSFQKNKTVCRLSFIHFYFNFSLINRKISKKKRSHLCFFKNLLQKRKIFVSGFHLSIILNDTVVIEQHLRIVREYVFKTWCYNQQNTCIVNEVSAMLCC